jgi:hypothetical protein
LPGRDQKAAKLKSGPRQRLSPEEMALIERLVDRGVLIAVPPTPAKPRKVSVASIANGGRSLLLYLAKEISELPD